MKNLLTTNKLPLLPVDEEDPRRYKLESLPINDKLIL